MAGGHQARGATSSDVTPTVGRPSVVRRKQSVGAVLTMRPPGQREPRAQGTWAGRPGGPRGRSRQPGSLRESLRGANRNELVQPWLGSDRRFGLVRRPTSAPSASRWNAASPKPMRGGSGKPHLWQGARALERSEAQEGIGPPESGKTVSGRERTRDGRKTLKPAWRLLLAVAVG